MNIIRDIIEVGTANANPVSQTAENFLFYKTILVAELSFDRYLLNCNANALRLFWIQSLASELSKVEIGKTRDGYKKKPRQLKFQFY